MNDLFINDDEHLNTEFDKWLGNQLKDSQVDPSPNFSQIVLEKLSDARPKGLYDPTILFVLVVLILISTIFITLSSLSTDFLTSITQKFFSVKPDFDLSATSQIVLVSTILGLILFGIDQLLIRKVAGKKISFE